MSPPKEGHRGVTEFFIGDQIAGPEIHERDAAEGKRSTAKRRRRLNIIMKPQGYHLNCNFKH